MFIDSFQKKIWEDKYRYNDETFEDFCNRLANNIFSTDETNRKKLFDSLFNFEILFGGRINSNLGVNEEGLTLFNCYILSNSNKNFDSLEGILNLVTEYALTLKSEGGVGFCADFFRPEKTLIKKIGVLSPGPIKFLEIFDKVSEVITAGSVNKDESFQGIPTKNSIRKGATMVTMSISNPNIENFITAKATPNRLMHMNMSVLVTDAFMKAVDNDDDWDLWFPNVRFEKYDDEWDGDFEKWVSKGYPTVVYKTLKARNLWELLLKNTYSRNEPGIIFIDSMKKYNNLHYFPDCTVNCTNPCAEVFSSVGSVDYKNEKIKLGDVCNLGSINVVKFYDIETDIFNFELFNEQAALLVRSLDNIIDLATYPLEQYELSSKLRRKIGAGLTGIGSLFMMMNIRYGSQESIEFLEQLLRNFMNTLYRTSALLAKEKGPFELYSEELLNAGYTSLGLLDKEVIDLIRKYGIRNSALSAIAPNGTLSILAGNVSGGLEPVFSKEYTRWNRVEGTSVPFVYPDIHKGEWYETDYFKESSINSEKFLLSTDELYRIDKSNGLCKKELIQDYGYKIAKEHGFDNVAGATELSIDEHLNILGLCNKFIDLSTSKTINIPNDLPFEEFKKLYGKLYNYGVKGCTTYREGTMVAVLETDKKKEQKSIKKQQKEFIAAFKEQENGNIITKNVKLPDEYPSKGFILRSEGKKWYLHVAFKDKECTKPFAIFVNTNAREDNVSTFNALDKLEELAKSNGLDNGLLDDVESKYAYQKNPVKICRMLGFLLRHNISVYDIVMKLDAVEEAIPGTFVHRIKKFLGQFITNIHDPILCSECGEKSVVFSQGCFMCTQCGNTKC